MSQPQFDPVAVNEAFALYMVRHGIASPEARRVSTVAPLDGTGATDCWTHAWEHAHANPGTLYVEGVCRRRGRVGIAPHAWIIEPNPFGGANVLELTETYEGAYDYRGLVVDHTLPLLTGFQIPAGTFRPSMIQLYAGVPGRSISDAVRTLVR